MLLTQLCQYVYIETKIQNCTTFSHLIESSLNSKWFTADVTNWQILPIGVFNLC